jgi:hypothetical protein
MKELFIGSAAVAYAAKDGGGTISGYNEVDLLDTGAVAFFTEDGTLITTATTPASIANVKQFYATVGQVDVDGNKIAKRSQLIDRDAFHRSYCAYVAPVKQAKSIGFNGTAGSLNLPGTLVAGTTAYFSVGIQYEGEEPHVGWGRYEYLVKTGDVEADVVAGLVAAINNDTNPYKKWTANAEGTTGVTVTADEYGKVLDIAVDGILIDADRSTKTEITYGKGTPSQVKEYETLAAIENGDTNRVVLPQYFYSHPSQVDLAATYDLYTIQWKSEHRTSSFPKDGYIKEFVLAIPDGAQEDDINTIFTTILLFGPTTSSGSSSSGI